MQKSSWAQAHYDRVAHDPEYLAARIMIEVSEQIVERMKELGISQHELARRLGKKQPFISRLLNHGTNATIITLATIADALDAEWDAPALVGREARTLQVIQLQLSRRPVNTGTFVKTSLPDQYEVNPNDQQRHVA